MVRCSNYFNRSKECKNQAVYRQNEYVEVCADCFGELSDYLFKEWHKWFLSDRTKSEPTIWLYNSAKIIKGI